LFHGAVLEKFYGAFALLESYSDLFRRQIFNESHDDDVLILGFQLFQGIGDAPYIQPAFRIFHRAVQRREVFGVNIIQGYRLLLRAVVVDDLVPRDAVEPAREREADILVFADMLKSLQKNLMGEVLSFLTPAHFEKDKPVYLRLIAIIEQAER